MLWNTLPGGAHGRCRCQGSKLYKVVDQAASFSAATVAGSGKGAGDKITGGTKAMDLIRLKPAFSAGRESLEVVAAVGFGGFICRGTGSRGKPSLLCQGRLRG